MTKTIDALVEALELADATLRGANMNRNVVERKVAAALAQARAEQVEPCGVVESAVAGCEGYHVRVWPGQPAPRVGTELYTHPPAAQAPKLEPLTDEQIEAIGRKLLDRGYPWEGLQPWVFSFARAVEAAHNAKLAESQKR